MESLSGASLTELPEEMLKFIVQHTATSECAARLSQLTVRGRTPISTPHYIATTSRGVIPHLSQDNLQKHTKISAVYLPLEDCAFLLQQYTGLLTYVAYSWWISSY